MASGTACAIADVRTRHAGADLPAADGRARLHPLHETRRPAHLHRLRSRWPHHRPLLERWVHPLERMTITATAWLLTWPVQFPRAKYPEQGAFKTFLP
jgi:hypothetical protein